MLRTHTCGELGIEHVGQEVTLCGWVDSSRDHGGAVFLDVRDRYGKTQVVAGPEAGAAVVEEAKRLRSEYVVRVTGKVARRPEGTVNPKLSTGAIELRASKLETLNPCAMLPFTPSQQETPGEDLRLKYRYLDLRRPEMQRTLLLRNRIIKTMRDYFDEHRFHRCGDAGAGPQHARGRPRLSGSEPRAVAASSTRCRSRRNCTSRF